MWHHSFSPSATQTTKLLAYFKKKKKKDLNSKDYACTIGIPAHSISSFLSLSSGCSWAAAALLLLFGAHAFPIGDSSGEEEFGEDPSSSTSAAGRVQLNILTELALWLQGTAATWNQELCTEQNACKGTMEIMAQNNLNLPRIIKEDGCYQPGFQKESCLRKLSSGLYAFRTFLEYIEETTQRSVSISTGAQHLAETLKSMMNNPETVITPLPDTQKTLAAKLREQRAWNMIVTKHFILQAFTLFMETTSRVIRLL
ncbi:interleukin-6 [Notechis scutatus]|uniref:Interleukin-6 n=1 Tax=Notechis scutatus TaxID=8663 RepID=A0A6J1UTY3_9SAUR|nr:interleukin-6 [Notechis scutatus]